MSTKKTDPLQKCNELINRLNELKKAIGEMNVASNRKPANALGAGWSQDGGTGAFHHSTHGVISTFKHPQGGFEVRHNGQSVGRPKNIGEAGGMIRSHVGNLGAPRVAMKADDEQYWSDASKRKQQKINREMDHSPRPMAPTSPKVNDPKSINPIKPTTLYRPGVSGKISKKDAEKQYSPAEIAALEEARKLKKNTENAPWDQHSAIPNADEQVQLYQKVNPAVPGEDAMANQLANMMKSKAMMRPDHRQPSSEEMVMAGQAMGLVPTEEMQKAQEQQWGGAINNWLVEASKPISSRFSSPEEEERYWDSIKVNGGKSNGDYGF